MITNDHLLLARPNEIGGVQRVYRFANGMGVSLINARIAHGYAYAWEGAVLKNVRDDGNHEGLDYTTELTSDVEVFMTDEAANAFIARAALLFAQVVS